MNAMFWLGRDGDTNEVLHIPVKALLQDFGRRIAALERRPPAGYDPETDDPRRAALHSAARIGT